MEDDRDKSDECYLNGDSVFEGFTNESVRSIWIQFRKNKSSYELTRMKKKMIKETNTKRRRGKIF